MFTLEQRTSDHPSRAENADAPKQEEIMASHGEERRAGKDRRLQERRRTTHYRVHNLVVIDGITWIDGGDGANRRLTVRRQEDREELARRIIEVSRP